MPGGAAHGLNERISRSKKPLLVRVEDRHQRNLRQIQSFAQKVDPDQNIELTTPETTQNLDSLERVNLRMQISAPNADLCVVLRQILRHALGQGSYQHAFVFLRTVANLVQQIIDLSAHRTHFNLGIGQAGRTNHLFDNYAAGFREFIRPGRRRNINELSGPFLELLKCQRTIVQRGRQPKAVFDQVVLARPITVIHAAKLRHGLMALVDEHQRILRKIIKKRRRRLTWQAARKVTRVIFNAVAVPDLLDHLQVEQRPLMNPL